MAATVEAQRRSFAVEAYDAKAEAGILSEDDRVELLNGEIVETSPTASEHARYLNRPTRLLSLQIDDRAILRQPATRRSNHAQAGNLSPTSLPDDTISTAEIL